MSDLKAKSKKRVLIFNYEFPPLGGGGGKASFFLARELVRKGWKVEVITSRFKGLARKEIIEGVEVHRIPVIRRKVHQASVFEMATYMFSSIIFSCWRAWQEPPNLSLAYFGIPSGPAAYFLKLLRKIPYFILLRGGDVPGFSPREMESYHRLTRPIIHFLWREAKGVIANSKGLQELAMKSSSEIKVQIIPNGVDRDLFKLNRDTGIKSKEINVLFAGRFTHQKGIDFLLNSLAYISPDISKTQIWLAGDGPERKNIENLVENRNLGGRFKILLLGWKTLNELYQLYQETDIFVLPSRDEGMPNALLEAMAAALPVIATRVAGSEELVKERKNGFLVEIEDLKGLAQALERLISDPVLRKQMGIEGRKIAEGYNWDIIADRFIEQFDFSN